MTEPPSQLTHQRSLRRAQGLTTASGQLSPPAQTHVLPLRAPAHRRAQSAGSLVPPLFPEPHVEHGLKGRMKRAVSKGKELKDNAKEAVKRRARGVAVEPHAQAQGHGRSHSFSASSSSSSSRFTPTMTTISSPTSDTPPSTLLPGDAPHPSSIAASSSGPADPVVPALLQAGTPLTKVSGKKQQRIVFRLDPDQGHVVWETKKLHIIPLENVVEIRYGSAARLTREALQLSSTIEPRWLTVVYTLDSRWKTLNIVAPDEQIASLWHNTLRALVSARQALLAGVGGLSARDAAWARQYWAGAASPSPSPSLLSTSPRLGMDIPSSSSTPRLGMDVAPSSSPSLNGAVAAMGAAAATSASPNANNTAREGSFVDAGNRAYGPVDGEKLMFDDVARLCRRLNIQPGREDLARTFAAADVQGRGYLDFEDFTRFVRLLKARPELERLWRRVAAEHGHGSFGWEAWRSFMRLQQKSTLSDEDLKRLFLRYASVPADGQRQPQNTLDLAVQAHGAKTDAAEVARAQSEDAEALKSGDAEVKNGDGAGAGTEAPAIAVQSASGEGLAASTPVPTTTAAVPSTVTTVPASSTTPDAAPHSSTTAALASTSPPTATPTPALGRSPSAELLARTTLSIEGFTAYLLSPDNAPLKNEAHDMTKPLSEYYVSSSHNTYLVGNQLTGESTVEGYIRALLHSCRSVELDIYDGETEPVVYHGKTLTRRVPLRDICNAIAQYAFVVSPYPVILSAEVHCSVPQQEALVRVMHECFKDALISVPPDGSRPEITVLPSPEDLKGKVLLKAKNLFVVDEMGGVKAREVSVGEESSTTTTTSATTTETENEDEGEGIAKEVQEGVREVKDEVKEEFAKARALLRRGPRRTPAPAPKKPPQSSSSSSGSGGGEKQKARMSPALVALLVYTVGVKCRGLNKKVAYAPEHIFSLSENALSKLLKAPGGASDLAKHCRGHVVRVYPRGTRLASSNYAPHRAWAAGCQLVAINWQTCDLGFTLNHAMFQRNNRAGYVLKPAALRMGDREALAKRTQHFLDIEVVSAQQLPRPKDDNGREVLDSKGTMDPFVEVSVHVPDWMHVLPKDTAPNGKPALPGGEGATPAKVAVARTGVVKNNGFNPVWAESLSLPFDVLGGMRELVFVRVAVRDASRGIGGDEEDALAVWCASVGEIAEGWRHLPLCDARLSQYLFSTLFVKIGVRDA
ncbi:PLC-like phosphodiesterase [Peniophora sp. CONT]|nr:PLC-like phosphodiesterase [Peniophora sp. CONT]